MKKLFYSLFIVSSLLVGMARAQTITTVAGNGFFSYSGFGSSATVAQLLYPSGVAADASGNIYVVDQYNHVVRKVNTSGVITTVAGKGTSGYTGDGGAATAAELSYPFAVAVDGSGNIYIADQYNDVVRKVNTSGVISTFAGSGVTGFSGDGGQATAAKMDGPSGVAIDASGNVYIADQNNNRIRKVNTSNVISTFAGKATNGFSGDGGQATAAELDLPYGVAVDGTNVYIADYNNSCIRKVNASNIISTYAGSGLSPGYTGDGSAATAATLYGPTSIKMDGSGNLYIADYGNSCIRKVSSGGTMSTFAGSATPGYKGDGGAATAAFTNYPSGVAVDGSGNVYIADYFNQRVRKVASGTISTFAGGLTNGVSSTTVSFNPTRTYVDGSGNMYICDADNNRVCKVSSTGTVTTVAGNYVAGYYGDGGAATAASLYSPSGIAFDGSGNMYICDQYNYVIRKVTTSGVISTFAGDGTQGFAGDGGPATAAEFDTPGGIAFDASGNLYVADEYNNRVRKISTSGTITTVVGTGSGAFGGDGGAAVSADIQTPQDIAFDATGNMYIADADNNRIRKVNTSGIITTIAGDGTPAYGGDGSAATAAQLQAPGGVAVDANGNIYIADALNNACRRVNAFGNIYTIAGTGVQGFSGDGGPATAATLGLPLSMILDASGNAYICDYENARMRKMNAVVLPAITGTATVCATNTTALTNATTGGTWSSMTTAVATVGTGGVVTGVSAGTATIVYSVNFNTVTKTVTVLPLPVSGTITGTATVCPSATTSLTDGAAGGVWSSAATTIATVGTGGVVSGVSPGTAIISYTVTNSCGTQAATKVVTVNPAPFSGPITGTPVLCQAATTSLTDATTGGVWSSGNTSVATVSSGTVSGVAGGTATISYAVTNSCGTATATQVVTVNPLPAVAVITGLSSVCVAANITLSDATSSGVWSSSNTNASVAAGVVTGVAAGTVTISYAVTNSCGTTTVTKAVTVNPLPTVSPISGSATGCVSGTLTLSDATGGGAWKSSTTTVATISGGGIVSGVSIGTTTISYTVTNSCGAISASTTVTITTTPTAGSISGPASVCIGSTVSLSDATPSGVWKSANTSIATVSGGTVSGVATGTTTISYTVSNVCGSSSALYTMTVLPSGTPVSPISGLSSVCVSSAITLSDATSSGVWGASNTAATVSGGIVTGVVAGVDTISYSVTGSCGTTTVTKAVTVNPLPAAGTITGSLTVCKGSATALTDVASGGAWSSSTTSIATVNSIGMVTGVNAGTSTISYTVTNSCGSATATFTITVNPLPVAGSITGTATVCAGATTALTDAASGGVWSSSNTNATVSGGTVTGVNSGTSTISYSVTNSCGTANAIKVVTVNPLPTVGAISGLSGVCTGSSISMTDATLGGVWSSDNTAVATISGTSVSGVAPGTAIISYTVTNGCGPTAATKTVTVVSSASAGTITGVSAVCVTSTVSLTDAVSGGVWSSSNTTKATVSGGVVTGVATGTSTISYSVTNSCGTAVATATVTVNPLPVSGTITGLSSVCESSSITLTDITVGGVWSSDNTSVATVSGGSVTGVVAGTVTISYAVTNSCGTATTTKSITVNPLPVAGTMTGTASACVGLSTTLTTGVTGGVWSSSNTTVARVIGGTVTGFSAGTATISYAVTNTCGTANATSVVIINPLPAVITGSSSVCDNGTAALSNITSGGVWSSGNTTVATVNTSGLVSGVLAGTTTISYTLTTGCAASKTITVNAAPLIYTVTGGGPYCAGDTGVHITLSGSTLGISYGIYDGPTLKGTKTGGGSSVDFGLFTAAATYTVTATNLTTTCASNMIGSATVTINPVPSAITGTAKVCAGLTTALSDATAGGTWSSSNTSLATVGTTGIVAGVAAGTPSVMYTLSTGCKATVTVTVNPVPAGISGAGSVCTGLSVSMSDATPSGTWSTPGTSVLTITSSGTVTGSSAGTTVIIYTLSTGCSASKSFTVNPLPLAISGPVSVCLNATATISDASAGGTWSSGNTTVATVDPSTGLVTGLSTGVVTMTYMLPTGCSIAGNMTVDPLPDAGTITGAGSVCIDSTVRLSDVSGGGVWSSQSTLISVVATTGVVKGLSPGTAEIWYKLTSVCGTDSTSANITVNNCHVLVPKLEGIAASVTVVPNPNDGVFNITGDLGVTDNSEVTLELTNMLGQVVYSNRIVAMHGIINEQVAMKNTLARGTYLLHVKSAEVNTVFHVVVDQ